MEKTTKQKADELIEQFYYEITNGVGPPFWEFKERFVLVAESKKSI